MLGRLLRPLVLAAIGLVALLALCPVAAWAENRHAGRIVLSLPSGGTGPLELAPAQGGWVGTFTVSNLGAEPLVVSRVAVRGDDRDVRSPSRLSVHFVDGPTTSATLAPGTGKDVVVAWMPDRDPRVRQAFGQVIVTSTDEETGEVAMGFRAQLPTGLGWIGAHVLTLLVALPLVVVLVAAGMRLTGRPDSPVVGNVALGMGAGQLLLAAWAYARFTPGVGRSDGNDGYQLIERAVWVRSIGAEWYVAVDGVNIALVLLTAVVSLVGLVAVRAPERRTDAYYSAFALLVSGLFGALVALDLVLLFVCCELVFVAMVMLVGGWGGARAPLVGGKTAVYGAVASAALLAAFVATSRASGRAFLVDGTAVAHALSVPELARTSFAASAPVLGLHLADGVWVLLFVAAAVMAPVVPLHGWLPDALEESPAGAAIVISGAAVALGPYLLVRIGMGAVGEGAQWAGPWVATLGVLAAFYGAFAAIAQRTLRRFIAFATLASTGASVFGIGSLTAEAVGGGLAGLFAHGIAASLLLGVAGALEARPVMTRVQPLALGSRAPRLAALLGAGLAVSVGVPCLAGFWGPLLVLLGGFARHPVMGLVLALSLVALAAAHVRVARIVLIEPPAAGACSALPDAGPRELAGMVPLVVLALLLGVWPVPLLSQMASGAIDASGGAEVVGK
jgi:NADH-quinone oxidoreductase subunit M